MKRRSWIIKFSLPAGFRGEKPGVRITYFVPDEKKAGGAYHTAEGRIRRINSDTEQLILEGQDAD